MSRVQFFAPHPDDIECFAGGTLLRHHSEGDAIEVVTLTRGGRGSWSPLCARASLEARRTREAEARIAELPRASLRWVDLRDGAVAVSETASRLLTECLAVFAPAIVYLPERSRSLSFYWHRDHLAAGALIAEAARSLQRGVFLRHYHSRQANHYVDVTPFFDASQRALRFYRSQHAVTAKPPFLLHGIALTRRILLARWARRQGHEGRYAEAFREEALAGPPVTPPAYPHRAPVGGSIAGQASPVK